MKGETPCSKPGQSHREGISIIELTEMFPTEDSAREWWERIIWPDGRHCPKCGSTRTHECSHKKSPYRCTDCRAYFSAKIGTAIESSKVPFRKWVFTIYLECTSLNGISSMKLHRTLASPRKLPGSCCTASARSGQTTRSPTSQGPVEVDETYMGGRRKNMPKAKRKELTGRGAVGKTTVFGVKDRDTNNVSALVI